MILSHNTLLRDWIKKTNVGSFSYRDNYFGDKPSIKQFPDPPISFLGSPNCLFLRLLAIVGPRQTNSYALKEVRQFIDHAPQYTLGTISGLAEGVDTECASRSIERDIPTIAILGGGLYQGRHNSRIGPLMRRIIESDGCILSEYPIQMKPTTYTFPQRNRIIIACSQVVFVPYAEIKLGTMLSIRCARDFDKPVYALPTPFDFESGNGSNVLIQNHQITAVVNSDYFLAKHFISIQTRNHIQSGTNHTNTTPTLSDPHQAAIIKILRTTNMIDSTLLAHTSYNGNF